MRLKLQPHVRSFGEEFGSSYQTCRADLEGLVGNYRRFSGRWHHLVHGLHCTCHLNSARLHNRRRPEVARCRAQFIRQGVLMAKASANHSLFLRWRALRLLGGEAVQEPGFLTRQKSVSPNWFSSFGLAHSLTSKPYFLSCDSTASLIASPNVLAASLD